MLLAMNKFIALLAICLFFVVGVVAQPTIMMPEEIYDETTQAVCVPLRVKDFTDITQMNFSITFDTAVLNFVNIQPQDPNFLSSSHYNTSLAGEGVITVTWESGTEMGTTIPDGGDLVTVFEICFDVKTGCGTFSALEVGNSPEPIYVTRVNTGPLNIGALIQDGRVGLCISTLVLNASTGAGNPGDIVCINFTPENFTNVTIMQYTITWDPAIVEFESFGNFNLQDLGGVNFGEEDALLLSEGKLTVAWFSLGDDGNGVTVDDGTSIYEICFRLIGPNGSSTFIEFGNDPTSIEIGKSDYDYDIGMISNSGRIFINSADGSSVLASHETALPGETTCVEVTVRDFIDIASMQFNMNWDPNIVQFQEVNATGVLLGMDFNTANTAGGVLGVEWFSQSSITLDNDVVIFELCFSSIGELTEISDVFFDSTVIINDENETFETTFDGSVTISPKDIEIVASQSANIPGEPICIEFSANNFENVVSTQFDFNWETAVMRLDSIGGFNLPGLSLNNFNTSTAEFGSIFFDWSDATNQGFSMPEGTIIFKAYFTIQEDAEIDDCTNITFDGIENAPMAMAVDFMGQAFEVNVQTSPGQACVQNPFGFVIEVPNVSASPGQEVCASFVVSDFDQVVSFQFSMNWDTSILVYTHVNVSGNLGGLTLDNFNESQADIGALSVNWNTDDTENGTSLSNGTLIFEVCFTAVGESLNCSDINISSMPAFIEVLTIGSNENTILLDNRDGEICIGDGLIIQDTLLTPISCPDSMNGMIELMISGGQPPYNFLWTSGNNTNQNPVMGLDEGMVEVTIIDQSGLSLQAAFEMFTAGELPIAHAGEDTEMVCGNGDTALDGSQSSTGAAYSYNWIPTNGGQVVANADSLMPTISGADIYILEVTEVASGCQARDSVEVFEGILVPIDAGIDQTLACESDTITLIANDLGSNYTYSWTTIDGEILGDNTALEIQATAVGTYILEAYNTLEDCRLFDEAEVLLSSTPLIAEAGETQALNCSSNTAILEGMANMSGNLAYQWTSTNGSFESDTDNATVIVNSAADYTLIITDLNSGCTAQDEITITPSNSDLMAEAGDGGSITCAQDTLMLTGSGSMGANIIYQWGEGSEGEILPGEATMLNPRVVHGGTYTFIVRDTATACQAMDTVVVLQDTIAPIVEAGEGARLNCTDENVQLDASASEFDGSISYQWSPADLLIIDDSQPLMPAATQPGLFELILTNNRNGCAAMDTVRVEAGEGAPDVIIATPNTFGCDGATLLQLDATSSTTGADYTHEWFVVSGDGEIIDTGDPLRPNVTDAGVYQLLTTSPAGCSGSNEVTVEENNVQLTTNLNVDGGLSCNNPVVTLSGMGSSSDNVSYLWTYLDGVVQPNNPNQLVTEVTEAGNYEFQVMDNATSCVKLDTIRVLGNFATPEAELASTSDLVLNCADTTIQLIATIDSLNASFIWEASEGGNFVSPTNNMDVEVDAAGTYSLIASIFESGCKDTASIVISEFTPTVEVIVNSTFDSLICGDNSLILDASNSTLNADSISIEWTIDGDGEIISGANTLMPEVIGNAIFTLILTDAENECRDSEDVLVFDRREEPHVSIEVQGALDGCGQQNIILDASASEQGENLEFEWIVLQGGNISSGANTLTPEVDKAGTYELIITNTATGCEGKDTVSIATLVDLPNVDAGQDVSICTDAISLEATLPDTAFGEWTSPNSAIFIENPTSSTTQVADLASGQNILIWTQSTPSCPDYASDTVIVIAAAAPIANNDTENVLFTSEELVSFNLTANDDLSNINVWKAALISQPNTGQIVSFENGILKYQIDGSFTGIEEFSYELCSEDCPDFCDTALVKIFLEKDPNFVDSTLIDLANAITPNDDGLNDAMIFNILEDNPVKYPDNELIIFNRWGDVVYKAQPYLNNWKGTNTSGQALPHGTYYFIFRLNIYEGEILKGDVTILK